MDGRHRVAVLVGSLRRESLNRKLAHALIALAPPALQPAIVEIGALPLYDADHEGDPPAAVREFKQAVAAADAALFVTPEYNRSVPGVLKNAIDHASRPYGQSAWAGKPAAVITLSPGALGGFGANHHLRQSLVFLDMPTMQQPEAYLGNGAKLFAGDGTIAVPATREFLTDFMTAFAAWVVRNARAR
jgi:chromate reductase